MFIMVITVVTLLFISVHVSNIMYMQFTRTINNINSDMPARVYENILFDIIIILSHPYIILYSLALEYLKTINSIIFCAITRSLKNNVLLSIVGYTDVSIKQMRFRFVFNFLRTH